MNELNDAAGGEIPDAEPVDAVETETQETEVQEAEAQNVEEGDEQQKADSEPAEKQQKARTREFIDRLKNEKREAEKRAKEAEEELARLKADKPKREDFEDDDDYQDARFEYRESVARKKAIEAETEKARRQAETAQAQAWQHRVREMAADIPDLEQTISDPSVPITREMAAIIMDSDYGPQVAYRLAKNPSLAAEIAGMSEREAARAIGRLEAEVSPKPQKISKAPPPVETVTTRGASQGFDPARASPDDFAKLFRQNAR